MNSTVTLNGTEVVLFGNQAMAENHVVNLHKVTTSKAGAVTTTYMTKKEFGEKHGLKGAALKRAHDRYRNDRGVQLNSNLSALIAQGKVLLEKVTVNKDKSGFTGKFITPGELDIVNPVQEAQKLSDKELLAILESRKPKTEAPKPEEKPAESAPAGN